MSTILRKLLEADRLSDVFKPFGDEELGSRRDAILKDWTTDKLIAGLMTL
jgi:hypothetical protein